MDYSGIILRGRGGNPIRLCGSTTRKEIYPVPSNYTLDATVIVQGMINKSVNNVHPGQLGGYYGIWINSSSTASEVHAGNGGAAGVASRKSCSFSMTPEQTVAFSTYNTFTSSSWGISVDGSPAVNRTYTGNAATFNSGYSGAFFTQGWDSATGTNQESRVGLYIYMNKSLTAAELDSVSNDPYQLFRPLKVPLFFDIPKEPVKLPAQVAYKIRKSNQRAGVVGLSDKYDTVFAMSGGSGFMELVTGKPVTQRLSGPNQQIKQVGGKFRGFQGDPISSGAGGLYSDVKIGILNDTTIAFNLTSKPTQATCLLFGNNSAALDDITQSGGFIVYADPLNEAVWLVIWQNDNTNSGSYVYQPSVSIWLNMAFAELTGSYAFEITKDGTVTAYMNGVVYGYPDEFSLIMPTSIGPAVTGMKLLDSEEWTGVTDCKLNAVVITNGLNGADLTRNIWDAFEGPQAIPSYQPLKPVNTQEAYPAQDVTDGLWTPSIGTNLFEVIDETLVDDGDYIYNSTGSTCEIKLGAINAPLTDEDQQLTYRLLPGLGRLSVALKCGAVTIANWGPHILTGATQEITQVLSTAQAATITDYADLRVVFTSEV